MKPARVIDGNTKIPRAFSPKVLATGFCAYNERNASREFFEICEALEVAELIRAVGPFVQLGTNASEASVTMVRIFSDDLIAI